MDEPVGLHARQKYREVLEGGPGTRPLDFPPPRVRPGVRVNALVVHPETGTRQVCSGVIHREDLDTSSEALAYWPQRRLQDAIYGSVWACLVLRRHFGVAADDAARAAGVQPGSPSAPVVWEITEGHHVAVKMVEWARVHRMRGRLLEDPVKEVAAMQMLGSTPHPNVLGTMEVLQDGECLYSIMPYCRDGDLFGVVVEHAEENGGEIGMAEPVARYWFRQILWGLHHLQSEGICHRDLSLENVLVNGDVCMIIDMGMCLRVPYDDGHGAVTDVQNGIIRRLIKPQGVCGKHNYMSPEVFANTNDFDGFAIDLWAAGVVLYIMLTGFPPYDQASRADKRYELIVTGRLVEQLRNWDIFLSDEVGHLLQTMLQEDPIKRLTLAEVLEHPWVTNTDVQAPGAAASLGFRR